MWLGDFWVYNWVGEYVISGLWSFLFFPIETFKSGERNVHIHVGFSERHDHVH